LIFSMLPVDRKVGFDSWGPAVLMERIIYASVWQLCDKLAGRVNPRTMKQHSPACAGLCSNFDCLFLVGH